LELVRDLKHARASAKYSRCLLSPLRIIIIQSTSRPKAAAVGQKGERRGVSVALATAPSCQKQQ
jgi:hypothetical protein